MHITDDLLESPWMPPSPHREKIVEMVRRGRAHIEPRGHGVPPLFVYEDGGAIELPRVRLIEGRLVADASSEAAPHTTKHVDVCGSIDELKALLEQDPTLVRTDPDRLLRLLTDAERMLRRMQQRLEAYREFGHQVAKLSQTMQVIHGPAFAQAEQAAADLGDRLSSGHPPGADGAAEAAALAEQIRDVANSTEQALYQFRDAAILLGELYERIRGARDWSQRLAELQEQSSSQRGAPGSGA